LSSVCGITSGFDGRRSASRLGGPGCVGEEIGDRDGFVAMWAGTAWTETTAENTAVIATLLADVTRLAVGALVDDDRLGQAGRQPEEAFVRLTLAEAKAALAARVGTPDLATLDGEETSTGAAAPVLSGGSGIVTQRVVPPLAVADVVASSCL
jgi:hypothetical protein